MNYIKELIYRTLSYMCFAVTGYLSLIEQINHEIFFGIAAVLLFLVSLGYRLESSHED